MPIYLDFNATTPVHPDVLKEMNRVYQVDFGNASSRTHLHGQRAKKIVDDARKKIASVLGIESHELIFTSGATESNNLAILGLAKHGLETGRKHIISSVIEHSSVLEPLQHLEQLGFTVEYVPVSNSGRIHPDDVLNRLRKDTLLVTLMHANNETGIIQPIDEIGEALAQTDVYFHVDAAQTFGKLIPDLQQLKYDLLSITAHKAYGPIGVGGLVLRSKNYRRPPVKPLMFGGGQERGLRPGTLPVALIAGFGKAAELASIHHEEWTKKDKHLKEIIMKQIAAVRHEVNGDQAYGLPNCINVSFPGVDSEGLLLAVKEQLSLSNGSACTSSEYKPSYVIASMGGSPETAVRFSWGPTLEKIDLTPIINYIKSMQ